MANALFGPGREGCLLAEIAWGTASGAPTIKVAACRTYTFNSAHKWVSDVTTAGGVLVSTITLTGKAGTLGVASATDPTFIAVPSGAPVDSLIIYQASLVSGGADVAASAQRLIAFIDTCTNLPFTPLGLDVDLQWSTGSDKIFRL